MRRRTVVSAVAGFGAAGLMLGGLAPAALGQSAGSATHRVALRVLNYQPRVHLGALTQGAAATGLPLWHATATVSGKSYTYQMVGTDPFTKGGSASVTVDMIPLILKAPGHTFDPTVVPTGCDTASAVARMSKSPLFNNHAYPSGTTQYEDAFQRANFWTDTKSNPSFHLLLKLSLQTAATLTVPSADYAALVTSPKCKYLGGFNINYIDGQLKSLIASRHLGPAVLPFFLTNNAVMYQGTSSTCCVLGYHSAENVGGALQTYSIADFDLTHDWQSPGIEDVSIAAHELGEWMDDPSVTNPTPPWGHIGQVSGCQNNLEVGDPLTGTNYPAITMNGYTYHPQELVFESWYYRVSPSLGLNGWYSFNGSFKTPAAACR